MASCHFPRWQTLFYFTISSFLALMAISTALQYSPSNNATQPTRPITHQLYLNASRTLQKFGFHTVATLLHISPEIFLSSPNFTIFAIKDSALKDSSVPPWFLKNLLQYHTSPFKVSMDDLLKKPQGTCFPTLLYRKNVALTKVDAKKRWVKINDVTISHGDMFLGEHFVIHGVLAPFSLLGSQDFYQGWESIQSPACDANSGLVLTSNNSESMVEWNRIIHFLSSNGYVSFTIALNSVLDRILEDYRGLKSVTIFTSPVFASATSPLPMLDKIVRFHLLPLRVAYKKLASLPDKGLVRTLLSGHDLEITRNVGYIQRWEISGVEIVAPEIYMSKNFIVHGISHAFEMVELPLVHQDSGVR